MTTPLPLGALCHVHDPTGAAPEALVVVTAHCTERIAQVRLLTADLHHATGTQALLPATTTGLPGDLLGHAWPAYVPTADLHPTGTQANPADLPPAPVDPTLGETTGPTDPRWAWELAELERIQAHQCRVSLSDLLGETPDTPQHPRQPHCLTTGMQAPYTHGMATTTETDTLADNTTVRYEGSIEHLRGLYGWVTASYPFAGHTRYDITLNLGHGRGTETLSLVRRTSLPPGENPG